MIIYISTPQGEITTDHSDLVNQWQVILNGLRLGLDVTEQAAVYDQKIIEMFGAGSQHCGSEE